MTIELMKQKWPVGTRIKTVDTDLFGNKMEFKGTIVSYSEVVFYAKMDNGITRGFWPGCDQFSVIYVE